MANTDAAFGLRPVRHANGAPYNGAYNLYFATGATGVIAKGDPVKLGGSANTSAVLGYPIGTLPTVALADPGDGDPIVGVCVGVVAETQASLPYRADSTDRIIMVADDPNLIFEVQTDDDATSGTWGATETGLFANLINGTASTVYGQSKWELDGSDAPDSDYSNQVILIGLSKLPGNVAGPYSIWDVQLNLHQRTPGAIGDLGRFEAI